MQELPACHDDTCSQQAASIVYQLMTQADMDYVDTPSSGPSSISMTGVLPASLRLPLLPDWVITTSMRYSGYGLINNLLRDF